MRKLIIALMLIVSQISLADGSDKVDLQSLEKKYWSAKDDDFSVVQNRTYSKDHRYFLNISSGIPINDAYSKGSMNSFTGGYFFSERWGVELNYTKYSLVDNDATSQFINDHGTVPNHNNLDTAKTISAVFVPFYAKMSFLERNIIYFDMSFSLGIGQSDYIQLVDVGHRTKSGNSLSFDISQHFFFSEKWAFRVDFKNRWTQEERVRYKILSTESESARSLGTKTLNDSSLIFGFTYWH